MMPNINKASKNKHSICVYYPLNFRGAENTESGLNPENGGSRGESKVFKM